MKIFFYLLALRRRHFLDRVKRKPVATVFGLLLLMLLFGDVAGGAYFLNYLGANKRGALVMDLVAYLPLVVFFVPVSLLFAPSITPRTHLFTPFDPIDRRSRTTIEILYHISSSRYLVVILCLLVLFGMATAVQFSLFLQLVVVVFAAGIACLIVQTLLDPDLFLPGRIYLVAAFLTCCGYLLLPGRPAGWVSGGMIVCFWIIVYWLQFVSYRPRVRAVRAAGKSGNFFSILLRVSVKTAPLRITLIVGMLFKGLMLFIFVKASRVKPGAFPIFVEYLIFSNVILFTYAFNNAWGYLKNTYLNLAPWKDPRLLFKAYLCVLAVPVAIDAAMTLGAAMASRASVNLFAEFYLLSLASNTLIGWNVSLRRPFEVYKAMDLYTFRANTSIAFSFVSISSSCLCGFLILSSPDYPLLLALALAYLLLVGWLFYRLVVSKKGEAYIRPTIPA